MKILDRYIFRQFFGTFVLLVAALPLLFLITDLTDNLDRYLQMGLKMRQVAISYVYFIPQLVFWGFPVAALIATVFTIGNMTRHQEITAAKAGGVSFYRLSAPLIVASIILSVAAVGIGELVPVTNIKRAEVLGERERVTNPIRPYFVFRTESGHTLTASRVNAQAQLMNQVVLENRSADGTVRIHRTADNAVWDDFGWLLRDGHMRWIDDSGDEVTFHFGGMRVPELSESPEDLLVDRKKPEEMRYRELERFIRMIERSGGNTSPFMVGLVQKISLPVALFVIVLFGAPLATSSRRGGAAFGIGISLGVTMIYLMMFKVGEAMGESGSVDPFVAGWAPNVIFLIAALILMWRVRT